LLTVWSSVAINWFGIREAGIVGLITTLLKLVPLVVIVTAGLFLIDHHALASMNPRHGPPFPSFVAAFTIAFFSYVGIESATVPAEEVIDAPATISSATIIGTVTVIALYMLVIVVTMAVIPPNLLAQSSSPLAAVGERVAGPLGTIGVALGALVSIYTALHYAILLGAQIPMVAARDGLFPKPFQRLTRRGTPGISLLTTGLLASGLIVMNSSKGLVQAYTFINLMSTLATVIPYALCAMVALVLPAVESQRRVVRVRSSAIAVIAFGVSCLATAGAGCDAVYWFALLSLAGIPVYVWVKRSGCSRPEP
jgi:amino acid transporter